MFRHISPSFLVLALIFASALALGFHQVAVHVSPLAAGALFLSANFVAHAALGGFSASFGLNALDVLKLNAADDMTQLIEKNKNAAPELALFPAFDVAGTGFTTAIRTGYPSGAFTPIGGGVTPGGSSFDNVKVQCYPYKNPLQERDDVMRTHRKGREYALALAASGAIKGGIELLGKGVYYGARAFGAGANAFPGLIDLYDATNKFVDAAGTTASTGSSVWFIKFGDMEDGMVSMVFGDNRGFTMREWILQQLAVDGTKVADVWTNMLACAVGVQLADIDAVVRIGKLTEDSGKGLTDELGYKALEKFPVGIKPDVALMTKRSARQLRSSRTGTNGGAPNIAWPTDIAGIPIVETDSILNTESLSL